MKAGTDSAVVVRASADRAAAAQGVLVPTRQELAAAAAAYDQDWGELDAVLRGVCAQHPAHDGRPIVLAKTALVARAYAAGVERCVKHGPARQAVLVVGDHLWQHGAEVDAIVAAAARVEEPLSADGMGALVEQHGLLLALLRRLPECTRLPRSFAAKYLHFHHEAMPNFDGLAARALAARVKWDSASVPFDRPAHGDPGLWMFAVRLLRLFEACRSQGIDVDVRSLDALLWAPVAPPPIAAPSSAGRSRAIG